MREPAEFTITEVEERRYIEEDLATPGKLCLVATMDGTVVGMVRASAEPYRRTRHFSHVDSLWVDAAHRGRGVANGLLSALNSWARDHPEIEKLGSSASPRTGRRSGSTDDTVSP